MSGSAIKGHRNSSCGISALCRWLPSVKFHVLMFEHKTKDRLFAVFLKFHQVF
jgi:hypothetical protein